MRSRLIRAVHRTMHGATGRAPSWTSFARSRSGSATSREFRRRRVNICKCSGMHMLSLVQVPHSLMPGSRDESSLIQPNGSCRYEPGQYYKIHHDFIPSHLDFPFGPRLYTFFLYLSDVNSGGETHFPRLKVRVTPKAGRAVFWPSVLPGAYHRSDHRTTHEAIPVETGVKYAANAWLHLYDFRTPHSSGCAP
mmetsp:Transcript_14553/g.28410  ORF Transcript_14553/g.28410 Transcript_14553/m.28410 type:complete len:193 (-) Transcript_14553:360-938(-)